MSLRPVSIGQSFTARVHPDFVMTRLPDAPELDRTYPMRVRCVYPDSYKLAPHEFSVEAEWFRQRGMEAVQ